MNYTEDIRSAIDFMESHITEQLDYAEIAAQAYSSSYHFQRVFSICCGCTLGEYIRKRRLTLAGAELANSRARVIDVALKYGYESPDSFTKAFARFHGITPSAARLPGARLRSFPRMSEINMKGGITMDYSIKDLPRMAITGYGKHFAGSPDNRWGQQHDFMVDGNTRFVRYALQGMAKDCDTEYCVVSNIDDGGFDFMIGAAIPQYFRTHLQKTAGDYAELLTDAVIPAHTYVSAETERSVFSINDHLELRRSLIYQWLPESGYIIADAPEITVIHQFHHDKSRSYVEILIPIERAK